MIEDIIAGGDPFGPGEQLCMAAAAMAWVSWQAG